MSKWKVLIGRIMKRKRIFRIYVLIRLLQNMIEFNNLYGRKIIIPGTDSSGFGRLVVSKRESPD